MLDPPRAKFRKCPLFRQEWFYNKTSSVILSSFLDTCPFGVHHHKADTPLLLLKKQQPSEIYIGIFFILVYYERINFKRKRSPLYVAPPLNPIEIHTLYQQLESKVCSREVRAFHLLGRGGSFPFRWCTCCPLFEIWPQRQGVQDVVPLGGCTGGVWAGAVGPQKVSETTKGK